MDPMSIAGSLGAATAVAERLITLLRSSAETAKKIGKAEVVSDLLEAQVAMMDLLAKYHTLLDENRQLQGQIRDLTAKIEAIGHLEHHYEVYWLKQEDESLDGPFSPPMWEKRHVLTRLRCAGRGTFGPDQYGGQQCFRFRCIDSKEIYLVPVKFMEEHNVRVHEERAG
jgi:hypothetical protein